MKKKILICINDLSVNSIGVSLINLINSIDYTKLTVDLIFCKSHTQMISQISRNVNIINSPFDDSKLSFLDKLKYFHKYDMSIMYDIGNKVLSDIVLTASKNNYVYIHKNYRSIFVVMKTYENFINENKILKFKNYLFTNELLQSEFLKLYPDLNNRCHILNYIVDEKHIFALAKENIAIAKPDRCTLLVSVGTINDRAKNFTLMVKMMSELIKLNNHVKLWIIGDGPDLMNLRMQITQNHLSDYITLFGFKNNPYPYMRLSDYYLNMSDSFDSSTALVEARVLQKPIISTCVDLKNINTYIVSPDINKIAGEINQIILNKTIYNGANNFWSENQAILKKFYGLIK